MEHLERTKYLQLAGETTDSGTLGRIRFDHFLNDSVLSDSSLIHLEIYNIVCTNTVGNFLLNHFLCVEMMFPQFPCVGMHNFAYNIVNIDLLTKINPHVNTLPLRASSNVGQQCLG